MTGITNSDKPSLFPGFKPYSPSEKEFFHGRDNEIRAITEKLISNRFVAIIGNHGCGKTSVINCGVIPFLQSGSNGGKEEWKTVYLTPGTDPVGNLAGAIAKASGRAELKINLTDVFNSNPDSLSVIIKNLIVSHNEKVLIIVDQFEELFRYGQKSIHPATADSAMIFVNLLMNAVDQEREHVFLVVAVSSEYISDCTKYYRFTQSVIINRSSVLIPDFQGETLKTLIDVLSNDAGFVVEQCLAEAIVNEAGYKNIPLPVIQHTMMRAWSMAELTAEGSLVLTTTDYQIAGGLDKSLEIHCEEIYGAFDGKQKQICEMVFRTIAEKGAGNVRVRRPSSLGLIRSVTGFTAEELCEVIQKFCSAGFLKCVGVIPPDDGTIIDIQYEPVLYLWGRLKGWIDEEALSADMYLRLSEMSALFQQGKKGLLEPPELNTFLNWRNKQKPTLQWAMRYDPAFERAMVYLRTSENEYLEKEEKRKEERKKRSIWRKFFMLSLGFIAIVLAIIALITLDRKAAREKELKLAELEKEAANSAASALLIRKIEADSVAVLAAQKESEALVQKENAERKRIEALISAREAQKKAETERMKADSAAKVAMMAKAGEETAIAQKNESFRLRMVSTAKSMAVKSLQFNGLKDLQSLLAYQAYLFNTRYKGHPNDPDIYNGLYNVARQYGNDYLRLLKGHTGRVVSMAFVPGRKELFTSGTDGRVIKWNLSRKEQNIQVVYSGPEIVEVMSVSPDAGWLACGTGNSLIRMIPIKGGSDLQYVLKGHSAKIQSLVFSFDGKYLYSAGLDGKVLKWDLAAKTSVDIRTGTVTVNSIDISSGGNFVAGVTSDGKGLIWDTGSGKDVLRIERQGKQIGIIRFKPSENLVAVGYSDGSLEIWNIDQRAIVSELKAHEGEINDICFNNPAAQMATAGKDGSMKIWDLNDLKAFPLTFTDSGDMVITIGFSSDGQLVVAGTASAGDNVIVRPATATLLAENICNGLTRNLTIDEWYNYVGKDIGYEQTCSEKEFTIKVRELKQ